MKQYKVYLFDFDGTLFNTLPALLMVYKNSFKEYGVDVSDEEVLVFTREPLPDSYIRKGLDMDYFWDFVDVINRYLNSSESVANTKLYDDTMQIHKLLKEKKVISGIVTSNNIPHVKEIYDFHHVDYRFMNVFVGNGECLIPKPDPSPIKTALNMLNYQGELSDVVYVGDALNDVKAAENAGVDGVLLDRDNIYTSDMTSWPIIHSLLDLFN